MSVSVIIPAFDRPRLIVECIRSISNQTYRPIEIIISDNGTEYLSVDELRNEIDIDIVHLKLRPKLGASAARNAGINIAKGKYLAFLDDDDLWDKYYLQFIYEKITDLDCACVYGSKKLLREERVRNYKSISDSEINIPTLLDHNPGVGGINMLVLREAVTKVGGFDENLPRANDRAFALDLLLNGFSVYSEPKAISVMRQHQGERLRNDKLGLRFFYYKYRNEMGLIRFLYYIPKLFLSVYLLGGVRKLFGRDGVGLD